MQRKGLGIHRQGGGGDQDWGAMGRMEGKEPGAPMSGMNEKEGIGDLWVKWKRKDWDWGPMGWVEGERTGLGDL